MTITCADLANCYHVVYRCHKVTFICTISGVYILHIQRKTSTVEMTSVSCGGNIKLTVRSVQLHEACGQ